MKEINLPERIRIKDIAELAEVSVGTVDRVLHGRPGVSESSRIKVEQVLNKLDYQPNMYASALASNKKYLFLCLLPQHKEGDYWCDVEKGIKRAIAAFSDFHLSLEIEYYDPYNPQSLVQKGTKMIGDNPDGVMMVPTEPAATRSLTDLIEKMNVPYVFIDSLINDLHPLAFFGQNSRQSGYFAAGMLMLVSEKKREVAIIRQLKEGKVGSNQQENREIGFRSYIKEHYPGCKIHELNLYAKHPEKDESLLNGFFTEHPDIECGITFNSKAFLVGEYLEKHPKLKFKFVGYDLLERNSKCLKNHSIAFLIVQQPWLQGYNAIKTLCNYLILKKEVNCINFMPIDLLSCDNVDFYLKAQQI